MAHFEIWINGKLFSSYKNYDDTVDFVTSLIYKEDHLREKYRPYVKGNGFDDPLYFYDNDGLRNSVCIKFVSDEEEKKNKEGNIPVFLSGFNPLCGMSWNGFNLYSDEKSIKELRRIENRSAQLEIYTKAYEEREEKYKGKIKSLETKLKIIQGVLDD